MLRKDGSVFNCASQNFWHVLLKDWLQAIRLLLSQGRDISFPLILRAAFPLCSSSCSSCSVTIQMLIIQTELLWCFIMHVGERGMYCFLSCFVNLDHGKEHFVHLLTLKLLGNGEENWWKFSAAGKNKLETGLLASCCSAGETFLFGRPRDGDAVGNPSNYWK